ncbi:MAG: hypothetical protein KDK64_05190 [Chlamydiia bacterium]|nr:hypothetical protein [Chlamydiia bacterium]
MSDLVKPVDSRTQLHLEDQAYGRLEQARLDFKNLVNTIYNTQKISTSSDLEIIVFMHWFEENNFYLEFPEQEKIWNQFIAYREAFDAYQETFCGETLEETQEKLRAIDPELIGEKRWQEEDSGIVQCLKSFFYTVVRKFSNEADIARYQGRMTVLTFEAERNRETQKVLELFPKFFETKTPVTTLQRVNAILDRCEWDDTLRARKKWFEGYLKSHVNPHIDYLLQRELSEPAEFFSCVSEESEFFSFDTGEQSMDAEESVLESPKVVKEEMKPFHDEVLTKWEGEGAAMIISTSLRATLMDEELAQRILSTLLPLDQIMCVEQSPESPLTFDVTFKSPLVGTTPKVLQEGWDDMVHSPLYLDQKVTVHFAPERRMIIFPKGGFQMGIHIENLQFLYNKMSYVEGTALATFLKYHGFMSWLGNMNYPLHLATTVRAISAQEEQEVKLHIGIHDTADLPMPKPGVYPTGECLSVLKEQLNSIKLTTQDLDSTFQDFTWAAAGK